MPKKWRNFMGLSVSFNGQGLTRKIIKVEKEIKPKLEELEKDMEPIETEEEKMKKMIEEGKAEDRRKRAEMIALENAKKKAEKEMEKTEEKNARELHKELKETAEEELKMRAIKGEILNKVILDDDDCPCGKKYSRGHRKGKALSYEKCCKKK